MKSFKDLTGIDILEAMIIGLEKEWVKVNMNVYSMLYNGICFGCAATNALCELIQKPLPKIYFLKGDRLEYYSKHSLLDKYTLGMLEVAIDFLRSGNIINYNSICESEFPQLILPILDLELPKLNTENYKENLIFYKNYLNQIKNETISKIN